VPLWFDGTVEQIHMLKHSFLDIYLIALLSVAFYFITPVIGQHIKYQVSIAVYFTIQLSTVINTYIIIGENLWLSGLTNFLPILYYFIIFMFVFERVVELMQAIYQSSITDGLTGLYNRRYFHKRVSQFISQNRPFSIIFGDIDNFKKLNDTKGHQAGDDVLRQVAQIIMEISEDIGMSGRYGGEEMVLMIFDPNTVKKVAEEIRSRIEKETQVTLSLGYSKYRKGLTADQLIQQADQAMYKSKKSGKNKITAYSVG
jgi:diguanylate cyclase (GGDEF)-like protein